jgi:hypothetical protein
VWPSYSPEIRGRSQLSGCFDGSCRRIYAVFPPYKPLFIRDIAPLAAMKWRDIEAVDLTRPSVDRRAGSREL